MSGLSPQQESALRELAGVAEVIRGLLPNTAAAEHANRVCAWLAGLPPEHHAGFGEVDRNVTLLREALRTLVSPDTDLPKAVNIDKVHIANLLADLDTRYERAVHLFRS